VSAPLASTGRGATLVLLAVCAALAAVLWTGLSGGVPAVVPAVPVGVTAEREDEPASIDFALPPIEHYAELIERPLFLESRRPFRLEPAAADAPEPVRLGRRPALVLMGVVITPERRSAMLLDAASRQAMSVAEGAAVAGWRLDQVGPDGVVLRQGAQTIALALRDYSAAEEAQPTVRASRAAQRTRRQAMTMQETELVEEEDQHEYANDVDHGEGAER
jgi:hypothetical protein